MIRLFCCVQVVISGIRLLIVLYISFFFFLTYAVVFQVQLSDYIGKKYVILFFYPLDFTFVCPTGKFDVQKCELKLDSCRF